jgi:hypothetical protein
MHQTFDCHSTTDIVPSHRLISSGETSSEIATGGQSGQRACVMHWWADIEALRNGEALIG